MRTNNKEKLARYLIRWQETTGDDLDKWIVNIFDASRIFTYYATYATKEDHAAAYVSGARFVEMYGHTPEASEASGAVNAYGQTAKSDNNKESE